MTIVAACSWSGETWIGSDSASTDDWHVQRKKAGHKLIQAPFGMIGYTCSYRTAQIIDPAVQKAAEQITPAGLVTLIQDALVAAGWKREGAVGKLPVCEDLGLLVAFGNGKLFTIQSDLSIMAQNDGYCAVGSGSRVALGAMTAARRMKREPMTALGLAISAAIKHVSSCAGKVQVRRVR